MVWKASFLRACKALSLSGRKESRYLKGALQPLFSLFLTGARWTLYFCLVFPLLCPCGVAWNGLSAVVVGVITGFVTRVHWLFHGFLTFSSV